MDAERITAATMHVFGITRADLLGTSRVNRITEARQALAYALRMDGWSLEAIGELLGGRDHTTIIYSLGAAERRKARDVRYAERLQVLASALQSPQAHPLCVCGCGERLARLEERLARLEAA
jgi:chromosomal replication initiator protein